MTTEIQGDVGFGKTPAVTGGKISGQPLPQFFTVSSSELAALLELNGAAADLPIRGGEDGINDLRGSTPRPVVQFGNPGEDVVVARGLVSGGWHGISGAFLGHVLIQHGRFVDASGLLVGRQSSIDR